LSRRIVVVDGPADRKNGGRRELKLALVLFDRDPDTGDSRIRVPRTPSGLDDRAAHDDAAVPGVRIHEDDDVGALDDVAGIALIQIM
jgi:hypothetical protein